MKSFLAPARGGELDERSEPLVIGAPMSSPARMDALPYGRTGLVVSRLGLGTGRLGTLTAGDALRLLDRAHDLGIVVFDTAPSYGGAEEHVGTWLRGGARARAVVSTKVGYGIAGVADWTGASVTGGLERAARLFGGHVDVAHLHSCPGDVALRDDIQQALRHGVERGLVRVAAYSGENEDLDAALGAGVFGAVQLSLSVVDQGSRALRMQHLAARGLGVFAKRPLGNAPWAARSATAGPEADYVRRFEQLALPEPADGWASHALRFAAFSHGVHAALVGTASVQRLEDAVRAIARGPLAAGERDALHQAWDRHAHGWRGVV